jgi:hypothetical protein
MRKRIFREMKQTLLLAAILIATLVVKAQSPLAFGSMDQPAFTRFHQIDSNSIHKKWFVSKYVGISSGFMTFNGGSATFLSAPVGLQVYRQLNNNLYAFAGVSVAPSYFPYSRSFYQPMNSKNYGMMNANNFGVYSAARMGLMYINDEKTFSISGSIGVGRGYYGNYSPFYPSALRNNNNIKY